MNYTNVRYGVFTLRKLSRERNYFWRRNELTTAKKKYIYDKEITFDVVMKGIDRVYSVYCGWIKNRHERINTREKIVCTEKRADDCATMRRCIETASISEEKILGSRTMTR